MKIESFPRKLFLFRNNLCMFAQTQNELHNMKHMSILAVSLLALVACTPEKKQEADYSQYVNPMIGTDFTGNTYPGAQVPFGMVQLSPVTVCRVGIASRGISIRIRRSPALAIRTFPVRGQAIYTISLLCP